MSDITKGIPPPLDQVCEFGGDWNQCGPVLYVYRAYAAAYGYIDGVSLTFERYRAVRFTPCGAWVTADPCWHDKSHLRWVSLDRFEGKRLGYICKQKALRSLKRRKARQIQILAHNLACANEVYKALQGVL